MNLTNPTDGLAVPLVDLRLISHTGSICEAQLPALIETADRGRGVHFIVFVRCPAAPVFDHKTERCGWL